MNTSTALGTLCLIAASMNLLGCRSSTEIQRRLVGTANITIDGASGHRMVQGAEAAFYVYNPGPTPSQRAMYLALGTREPKPGAFSLELFQFLADYQETPSPGTFAVRYGALGGDPAMGGDVRVWVDTAMTQLFPTSTTDSLTLETVSPEHASGTFSIALQYWGSSNASPAMTIHGTFVADRVERYEDLPVVWW
jgi:hypothetical protein